MSLPSLPQPLTFTYLAEGAANVVYRLSPPTAAPPSSGASSEISAYSASTPPPSELEEWESSPPPAADYAPIYNKLLRVRKAVATSTTVVASQNDRATVLAPLFPPSQLVSQTLVAVPPELLAQLDAELEALDASGTRPKKRLGQYLSAEGVGCLVTDMSISPGQDLAAIELKPKWLVQSPSAPEGAKRCRTCAVRVMRGERGRGEGFCPLALVSGHQGRVEGVVDVLLRGQVLKLSAKERAEVRRRLVVFVMQSPLLGTLKELQARLDPKGVFEAKTSGVEFLTAMTLRDCTLFLKVPMKADQPIEGRLGDLDLKAPVKVGYWKSVENQLINGGWYEGHRSQWHAISLTEGMCELEK